MRASRLPKTAPSSRSEENAPATTLAALLVEIQRCRICRDRPIARPLPHEPRPVVRASTTARIVICGQAPGTRVHASGMPFTDPSGDRLRTWMGVTEVEFYDTERIAIVPMGFCFPGLDGKGSDLLPRRECAAAWHTRLFGLLPQLEVLLLVGQAAQKWHLGPLARLTLGATVADWRRFSHPVSTRTHVEITVFNLPHPSWRNTGWLKKNPWFETDVLPDLRRRVRAELSRA